MRICGATCAHWNLVVLKFLVCIVAWSQIQTAAATRGDAYEGGVSYIPPDGAVVAFQWGSLQGDPPRLVRDTDSIWFGARYSLQAVASRNITGEIITETFLSFQGTTYNATAITFVGGLASLPFAYYVNNTLMTDPTAVPSFDGQMLDLPTIAWPYFGAIPALTGSIFSLHVASSSLPAPITLVAGAVLPPGPLTMSLQSTVATTGTVVMNCAPIIQPNAVSTAASAPFSLSFVLHAELQHDLSLSQGIPSGAWECFLTSPDLTSDIVVLPARMPFVIQTSNPLQLQLIDADGVPVKHLDTLLIGPSYALQLRSSLPVDGTILMTCALSGSYKFKFHASQSLLSSASNIASSTAGQDTCVFTSLSDLTNQLLAFTDWTGNSMNINFGSVNLGISAGVLNDDSHATALLFQSADRTQDIPSGGPWTVSMTAPTATSIAWSIAITCTGTINGDSTTVSLSFVAGSAGSVIGTSAFSAPFQQQQLYSCSMTGASTPSTVHVTSNLLIHSKNLVALTLSYDLGSGNTAAIGSSDAQWLGASTPLVLTTSVPMDGTVRLLCTITSTTVASATFTFHQTTSSSALMPITSQSASASCAIVPDANFIAIITAAPTTFTLSASFASLSFDDSDSSQSVSLELGTAAVGSGVSAHARLPVSSTTAITVSCVGTNGEMPTAAISLAATTSNSALLSPPLVAQAYSCSLKANTASGFVPRALFTLRAAAAFSMTLAYNDAASTQAAVLLGGVRQWLRLHASSPPPSTASIQGTVSLTCGASDFTFAFDGSSGSSNAVEFIPPIGSTCHWSDSSVVGVSLTLPVIPIPSTLSFGSGFSGVHTLGAAVLNVSDPNLPQTLQLQLAAALQSSDSISLQFACRSTLLPPSPIDALTATLSVAGGASASSSNSGFTQQSGVPLAQVYKCQVSMNAIVDGTAISVASLADFISVTLPVTGLMPVGPCSLYDPANIGSWTEKPITVSQPFPSGFMDGVASPRGGLALSLAIRGTLVNDGTSLGAFTSLISMNVGSAGLNQTGFYSWPALFGKDIANAQLGVQATVKASASVGGSSYTGPVWSRVAATYTDSFVIRGARDNSLTAPSAPGVKFTRLTTTSPPSSKFTVSEWRSQNGLTFTSTFSGTGTDANYPTGPASFQCLADPTYGSMSSVYWPVPVWGSPYGADFIRRSQRTHLLPSTVFVFGRIVPATN